MKKVLLGATVLMGLSMPAMAQVVPVTNNEIAIEADAASVVGASTGGSVASLSIVQDDANPNNRIAAVEAPTASGISQMQVAGPWNSITITQTGGGHGGSNILYGAQATDSSSGTASILANYTATGTGNNVHSLTVGANAAPKDPTIVVNVTNTGNLDNTITDSLDGGATTGGSISTTGLWNGTATQAAGMDYALTIYGKGNTVTNTVANGSTVYLHENIQSDGNAVSVGLSGTGTQVATLAIDGANTTGGGTSVVNYVLGSAGANQTSNVALNAVNAGAGNSTDVVVNQTSLAGGATAVLTYTGTGATAGAASTLPNYVGGYAPTVAGYTAGTASIVVNQNSSGAVLNAGLQAVTGSTYAVLIKQ